MDSESILSSMPRKGGSLPHRPTRRASVSARHSPDNTLAQNARDTLLSADLFVANSIGLATDGEGFTVEIDGDFEEFAKVAKELGVRVVFFEAAAFNDTDFESENDEGALTDLREIEPQLRGFEQYLDTCHLVRAVAPFTGGRLVKHDCADWYVTFSELRDRVLAKLGATATEEQEEQERLFQQQQDAAIKKIRELDENKDFKSFMGRGRQTLQSIVAYIRENIDEAQYLTPGAIRDQARSLKDKALVQG